MRHDSTLDGRRGATGRSGRMSLDGRARSPVETICRASSKPVRALLGPRVSCGAGACSLRTVQALRPPPRPMIRAERLIGILALTACADGGVSTPAEPAGPPVPVETVAGLRGTVDVAAATLTFEPLPTRGISRHVVGDPRSTGI